MVDVGIEREGEDLLMRVVDYGDGIEADVLPHVFEPFRTTKRSGTGLGLAVVHRIVESHGGRIEMDSELGAGTKVFIQGNVEFLSTTDPLLAAGAAQDSNVSVRINTDTLHVKSKNILIPLGGLDSSLVGDAIEIRGEEHIISAIDAGTNTVTLATPLIGDANREHAGKNMTQETRQVEMLRPAAKELLRVESIQRIPELMRRAFEVATRGRPGPVIVDVPEEPQGAGHASA